MSGFRLLRYCELPQSSKKARPAGARGRRDEAADSENRTHLSPDWYTAVTLSVVKRAVCECYASLDAEEDRRRLECYSPTSFLTQLARCTADYLPLPKWRRQAARSSLLDLLNLLRHQILARGVDAPMVNFDDLTSAATPPDVKSSKLTMRRKMPAFPNASRPTRCATPSPRICWKTEPTRASFRRLWATRASTPLPATPGSRRTRWPAPPARSMPSGATPSPKPGNNADAAARFRTGRHFSTLWRGVPRGAQVAAGTAARHVPVEGLPAQRQTEIPHHDG